MAPFDFYYICGLYVDFVVLINTHHFFKSCLGILYVYVLGEGET